MPFKVDEVIHNRYKIVSLLGQGGMGKVYRARDLNLNISVALKEMIPDLNADPQTLAKLRKQFKDEAQIVATLDHPNLVRVTDYFSAGQSECLVMNFVEGENLADRVNREGAQSERQIIAWAQQLLDALAYCHSLNVIHRDIKPQNIVITAEGRPVLVDFGLVKLWDPKDPHTQTVIRAMGTPEYAPPEQYGVFPEHTGPRSDLYSLGALLYHALTGIAPLSATDRIARPDQFPRPCALNTQISPRIEAVILKAMELPIDHRFRSAQEMAQALRSATAVISVATRPTTVPQVIPAQLQQPQKRTPWLWWGLGGVFLLLLFILGAMGVGTILLRGGGDQPIAIVPTQDIIQEEASPDATLTAHIVASLTAPTSIPVPTLEPTTDVRATARAVVDTFQEARATAYSTWDTALYYDVLVGEALESSLAVIEQLRSGDCRYYTTDEAEMTYRYEEESASRIVVIASRSETQRRECAGSIEYVCQAFDGRYVVELWGDRWVIVSKSIENYREVSPCP